jgi:hypothetical protein
MAKQYMMPDFQDGFNEGAAVSAVHGTCASIIAARLELERVLIVASRSMFKHVLHCPKSSAEDRHYGVFAVHGTCASIIAARLELERVLIVPLRSMFKHVLHCPKSSAEDRHYAAQMIAEAERRMKAAGDAEV